MYIFPHVSGNIRTLEFFERLKSLMVFTDTHFTPKSHVWEASAVSTPLLLQEYEFHSENLCDFQKCDFQSWLFLWEVSQGIVLSKGTDLLKACQIAFQKDSPEQCKVTDFSDRACCHYLECVYRALRNSQSLFWKAVPYLVSVVPFIWGYQSTSFFRFLNFLFLQVFIFPWYGFIGLGGC